MTGFHFSLTYSHVLWIEPIVFHCRIYLNAVQLCFLEERQRSYLCYKYWKTKYERPYMHSCNMEFSRCLLGVG